MKTTLFIIDDDEIFQEIMKMAALKFKSFENIVHFRDAEVPLKHLVENKLVPEQLPDAIFIDLNIPVVNGWTFLDGLAKIYDTFSKKVWVYIVTTSLNRSDEARAKKYNFVEEFISKPVYGTKLMSLYQSIKDVEEASELA